MTTTLVKQPAFIAPPPGKSDVTSGMQRSASGSVIGNRATTDGTLLPGQDIGRAAGASYVRVTTV